MFQKNYGFNADGSYNSVFSDSTLFNGKENHISSTELMSDLSILSPQTLPSNQNGFNTNSSFAQPVSVSNTAYPSNTFSTSTSRIMFPYIPAYQEQSLPESIDNAILSPTQLQKLKFKKASKLIDIECKNIQHAFNNSYNLLNAHGQDSRNVITNEPKENGIHFQDATDVEINYNLIISDFIAEKHLIKILKGGIKPSFQNMIWSEDYNHYVPCENSDLKLLLYDYISDKYPDVSLTDTALNNLFRRLCHSIKRLEKSSIKLLPKYCVMFTNGIFNVESSKFIPLSNEDIRNYFTNFSFNSEYPYNAPAPIVFDKLLDDMLDNNERAKQLVYEQIGAIICHNPTLKTFFLYQGASNGGKTRLANIISKLLPQGDVCVLDDISGITDNNITAYPRRLIHVKELKERKLSGKQLSTLKSHSDGSDLSSNTSFKILLSTNYAIKTGDNGYVDEGIVNRISVIPFPRAMKNSDPDVSSFEDYYLENEKNGIILMALNAFSRVIKNGNRFSFNFPLNQYVINSTPASSTSLKTNTDHDELAQSILQHINPRMTPCDFIKKHFRVSSNDNPNMTAQFIMDFINKIQPGTLKNTNSLGGFLPKIFGDELIPNKKHRPITYNLEVKTPLPQKEEENDAK